MPSKSIRLFFLLLFFCPIYFSYAQSIVDGWDTQNLPEEKKEQLRAIVAKRKANAMFLQTTMHYADFGWVSPPVCDVGMSEQKQYFILSADIKPHFIFGGERMPIAIHLTPRFQVRIFKENKKIGDTSLPVRTPSYMPGGTVYFSWKKQRLVEEKKFFDYVGISLFHHSNGQDGEEIDPKTQKFNHYNGNFSTNFVEIRYIARWRSKVDTSLFGFFKNKWNQLPYHDQVFQIGAETHIFQEETLSKRYGNHRLNLRYMRNSVYNYRDYIVLSHDTAIEKTTYPRELDRWIVNATLVGGQREGGLNGFRHRFNIDASWHIRIPGSPNASGFIGAGYYGADPYNVFFDIEPYLFVRVGFGLGLFIAPIRNF